MLFMISLGFIASLLMIGFMHLITISGIANANMIQAIGGLVTRERKSSFKIGLMIYFLAGILFSIGYPQILSQLQSSSPAVLIFAGIFLGFAHGLIVGFAIVIEAVGRHPLPEFRNAGFSVAIAHILGHMVYGVSIGAGLTWQFAKSDAVINNIVQSNGIIYLLSALVIGLLSIFVIGTRERLKQGVAASALQKTSTDQ